ncbi:hypothetical protein [Saccharopolyspora shandongensis]|uniref:hypothetical protein n=1 Tax=Saccharopolyspora shandongensis TaxID=418495 RepID=UPI0033F2062C
MSNPSRDGGEDEIRAALGQIIDATAAIARTQLRHGRHLETIQGRIANVADDLDALAETHEVLATRDQLADEASRINERLGQITSDVATRDAVDALADQVTLIRSNTATKTDVAALAEKLDVLLTRLDAEDQGDQDSR